MPAICVPRRGPRRQPPRRARLVFRGRADV